MEQNKYLTKDEIAEILAANQNPRLRYTVDLYLLDYIKHCFLDEAQLNQNIRNLEAAVGHLQDPTVKKGVEDVLSSLRCVQSEYNEYLEDSKLLADGGYPAARGAGQAAR